MIDLPYFAVLSDLFLAHRLLGLGLASHLFSFAGTFSQILGSKVV